MMNWDGLRVCVTGSTGFVGHHLTKALVSSGAAVVAFVRKDSVRMRNLSALIRAGSIRVREGDIRRYRDVKETLSGCDVVFHLAAQAIVGESIRRPRATLETNIMGTVNVLEAARSSGAVEAIVVASTDKVYGEPKSLPVTEGHPLAWKNPYELSKVSADLCAQMFANIYGLPIAITRCSNIRARRRQFLQSHPELRDRRAARKASRDQEQR